MGFETQEQAEQWAENMEFLADQRKEERLLAGVPDPKETAWRKLIELPAYKDMPESAKGLQRAVFDYAWEAAMRINP